MCVRAYTTIYQSINVFARLSEFYTVVCFVNTQMNIQQLIKAIGNYQRFDALFYLLRSCFQRRKAI